MKWGYLLLAIALGIILGTYWSAHKQMKKGLIKEKENKEISKKS